MTKAQIEVITSVQRRRRWSRAEKERIVAATLEPGAVASEVARAAGIQASQLFRWRQQLCGRTPSVLAGSVFSPVAIVAEPGTAATLGPAHPAVEIEFASGARLRLLAPIDSGTIKAIIAALAKGRRR
jgi:transposase